MPKVALCCDVFASASVAACGNLYLPFIAVMGEGVGAAKVALCLCAAIWTSVKTVLFIGSFTKLVSLTSSSHFWARWNREHIPLFAVAEDVCCCLTQTLFFFLSTIMLWLVLSAGDNCEEDEGPWQVWYFFLGFESQPPVCFLFCQRCCVARRGDCEKWGSCVWDAFSQK